MSAIADVASESGKVLATPLPIRTFMIPTDADGGKLKVSITEPAVKADNLVLETWASSTVLASQLHHLTIKFPSENCALGGTILPIVELGAGTGVVGMAAAVIFHQDVLLTDLPPIVPALSANISLNASILPCAPGDRTVTVSAGVLDWTSLDELTVHTPRPATFRVDDTKAHVLLAADTLYSPEHPELLTRTIEAWLSRDRDARLVLGTAMRVAYLDELRELWARLETAGLETVWERRDMAEAGDFDDERLVEVSVWRWRQA